MGSPADEKHLDRVDDEALWQLVHDAYIRDTTTRDPALAKEIQCIREAMQSFRREPLARYVVLSFLGVGGVGIVFQVWDRTLRTFRALKIARPIEGKEDLTRGLVEEEISRLQEVSHPNVISIFDAGALESSSGALPFFTMTFLRGALPAQKYFDSPREVAHLLEFTRGLLAGLAHLHQANLLHLDLKPNNIFVGESGYAVVADLGGARRVAGDPEERLLITCTTDYAHPELRGITAVSSTGGDPNRRRGHVRRVDLRFAFDLFAAGKSIFKIIHTFESANPRALTTYTRKYLTLQAARLLDGKTLASERPLGLTEASLVSLRYVDAGEAVVDLDKLLGRVNPLTDIPELSPTNERVIQVTRGQKTSLTPRLARLLAEPLLRRLGTVSQLGLIRLVYPGATHTRLRGGSASLYSVARSDNWTGGHVRRPPVGAAG
jgi:serine/threonine protein kinase